VEFSVAIECTFSIIKPDAVRMNVIGRIFSRIEENNLKVVAARMLRLSAEEAGAFYAVHRGQPFFETLIDFMVSGPVMVQVLEGENAIQRFRQLIGATDPRAAAPGTLRAEFAESIGANAVHGSDTPEAAKDEIAFFFPEMDIYSGR